MNLFDILSMDERVIVYSSEEDQMIYTWNKSITLQSWAYVSEEWVDINVQVLSEEPGNYEAARKAAIAWSCASAEE